MRTTGPQGPPFEFCQHFKSYLPCIAVKEMTPQDNVHRFVKYIIRDLRKEQQLDISFRKLLAATRTEGTTGRFRFELFHRDLSLKCVGKGYA